jgi:hypothetical protein
MGVDTAHSRLSVCTNEFAQAMREPSSLPLKHLQQQNVSYFAHNLVQLIQTDSRTEFTNGQQIRFTVAGTDGLQVSCR